MFEGNKKHFTQLSCIIEALQICLQDNQIKIVFPRLNSDQQIFKCQLQPLLQQASKQKGRGLTLILNQMQYIMSFVITEKAEYQTGSMNVIDEFWLDYRNYFPKKIHNTYLLRDFIPQKKHKIKLIFQSRIVSWLKRGKNPEEDRSILFSTAIMNNLNLIHKFLQVKDFLHLEMLSSSMFRLIHCNSTYMALYEGRWGKTGFSLEERNWMKSYRGKIVKAHHGK